MAAEKRAPLSWLRDTGAQRDVIDGLTPFARDWPTLWNECPRGDWLLGIATRLGVRHEALVVAAVSCANVAKELAGADPRVGNAFTDMLAVATRWTKGEADVAE